MKKKVKIFYAFDPLCGWCYGISENLETIIEKLSNSIEIELEIELKLGGLFILEAAKSYREFKRHINTAQVRLKEVTGKTLSDKFIQKCLDSDSIANSSTPNQFLLELKQSKVSHNTVFKVSKELQRLHFQDGLDFNTRDIYDQALNFCQINDFQYELSLDPMDITEGLMNEYQSTRKLGGYGFPAFFIKRKNHFKHITHSYSLDEFSKTIEDIISR